MPVNPESVSALVAELQALHHNYRSWRRVAEHYRGVPAGTLCRIAKSGGAYLPKDRKTLTALGLVEWRELLPGEGRVRRKIATMAKNTRKALKVTG